MTFETYYNSTHRNATRLRIAYLTADASVKATTCSLAWHGSMGRKPAGGCLAYDIGDTCHLSEQAGLVGAE